MRNLYKYSKVYSGKDPEFIEGDVFRIVVPLDEKLIGDNSTQSTTQSTTQFEVTGDVEKEILRLVSRKSTISQKEIAVQLSMNINTIKYHIRKMQKKGILVYEGTNRKGKWIIK